MPTGPIPGSDGLGLLPLLNGGKIVALDAEGAVLETPGGTRQSYRRKPDQPGRVLIPPAGMKLPPSKSSASESLPPSAVTWILPVMEASGTSRVWPSTRMAPTER